MKWASGPIQGHAKNQETTAAAHRQRLKALREYLCFEQLKTSKAALTNHFYCF